MDVRSYGEELRTTLVCVDSYDDGVLRGRFYNPYLPTGTTFLSLSQFLQEFEQALDHIDFPKAFTITRTFANPPKQTATVPISQCLVGSVATFAVRILFRQNASWQGSVTWIEGKQEQSFRSALELILLLNSALTQKQAS